MSAITLIDDVSKPLYFGMEMSIIMDGSQMDCWYAYWNPGHTNLDALYYKYAVDSSCRVFSDPVLVAEEVRFPHIILVGTTYYMFGHWTGHSGIYLWSSTNKTTWTIMNGGAAVWTNPGNDEFRFTYNVGVTVVGNIWHMVLEAGYETDQSDVALRYAYSTLAELNWGIHSSPNAILPGGGNGSLIYVPDRNALMAVYGKINPTTYKWDIVTGYVSLDDDLTLSASWHESRALFLTYPGLHTTDPHVAFPTGKDHGTIIQFVYSQQSVYQVYADLTLNEFYDAVASMPSPSTTPSLSPSITPSMSPSITPSFSPSSSVSPSVGGGIFSKGDLASLPTNDNELESAYTDDEETKVSTRNGVMVGQTGILQYMIHQFKSNIDSETFAQIEWEGQSSLSPSLSTVYLQIYNQTTALWETIDTNTNAPVDVNFELSAKITDVTDYKDGNNSISCRVYQLALE